MKHKHWIIGILLTGFLGFARMGGGAQSANPQAYPYLSGFPRTEPGTIDFSSPSVVDLTGDGSLEILVGGYGGCVWGWDSAGNLLPNFPLITVSAACDGERIGGPLAVGNIDNDGGLEIVAGTRGMGTAPGQRGQVYIWNSSGILLPGWPIEMDWNSGQPEVSSVALGNISGDSRLEIAAGTTNKGSEGAETPNLYAWFVNGTLLPNFPTSYRSAGIWGAIAVADIADDGGAHAEIITGRDQLYLHAYGADGQELPGWPARAYVDASKTNFDADLYMEFTRSGPVIADLDHDSIPEIIAPGHVRDPLQGHTVTHAGLIIYQPNGQRKPGWEIAHLTGPQLASTYPPLQALAIADLNGDGLLDIIVPAFDGHIRAYEVSGAFLWDYDYAQGARLYASEPAIGDVSGDGKPDIVFGTYSPEDDAKPQVSLLGLDADGHLLAGFPLPLTLETAPKAGIRAGPTIADIDGDCTVEILAASLGGTLYVWDLPTPYYPDRMPWPTARHDNARSGSNTGQSLFTSGCPQYRPLDEFVYLPILTVNR